MVIQDVRHAAAVGGNIGDVFSIDPERTKELQHYIDTLIETAGYKHVMKG